MTPSAIDTATFRLVAQFLYQKSTLKLSNNSFSDEGKTKNSLPPKQHIVYKKVKLSRYRPKVA
jgi:hypothetical protein